MIDRPLWNHQVNAIRMAEKCPDMALFHEQGTGKTRTMIEIMRRRFGGEKRLMRTLILCPVIVITNWKREILTYSKIQEKDITLLTGSQKKRVKTFTDACAKDGVFSLGKIVVTNYEALQMSTLVSQIKLWNPEILICDESHVLKSHTSKRARALTPIADRCINRYILTGTPILNTSMDIFQQYRLLDGGSTFGKNFFAFRNTYFVDVNAAWSNRESHYPKYEARKESYEELSRKMYCKATRALKKDCMDLPPFIRQSVDVELGSEQSRLYKEMKHNFLTWIKDQKKNDELKPVIAQLAITKALRLQQIVSGYVKTEFGEIIRIKDNPRIKALKELLEPLVKDHKVIVWAIFKENYKMIADLCAELGIDHAEIHGDLSVSEKDENMDKFRKDPKCRVMVANQAAGGVGINLIEADYAIYFSKNFSLKDDLQSEARNYRGGSDMHEKVTRIDLVCRGTIDELINKALSDKQDISNKILDENTWSKI